MVHVSTVYNLNQSVPYTSDNNLRYQCYADVTKVYLVTMPKETSVKASSKLEACLVDVDAWISANMFMVNQEKTELINCKSKPH